MKYSILAFTLLLTACGGSVYKDVSSQQLAADQSSCNYEALKATSNGGSGYDRAMVYNQCLLTKGYHY